MHGRTTGINGAILRGGNMRKRLWLIPVVVIVALALMSTGAGAADGGRIASACSNQTVNGGRYVGKVTLRFVLIGKVSCTEAHSNIRAFFHHVAVGPCEGNICGIDPAGGWTCSWPLYAGEGDDDFAGCFRPATGAKIRVYKVNRHASAASTLHLSELAPAAWGAGAPTAAQSTTSCANERVALGGGSEVFYAFTLHGIACAKAHALITGYMHRVNTGQGCKGRGTACGYEVSGSWCSLPGYGNAPIDAGCCVNVGHPRGSCPGRGQSFTVRATSPPPDWTAQLHLSQFETPDGSISCYSDGFGPKGLTSCSVSSRNEFAVPAAWMEAPRVRVCTHREELVQPEGEGSACPAGELDRKVILADGQENELGGIRCVVAPEGVTCTFAAGAEAGSGFRINSTEVVQLG